MAQSSLQGGEINIMIGIYFMEEWRDDEEGSTTSFGERMGGEIITRNCQDSSTEEQSVWWCSTQLLSTFRQVFCRNLGLIAETVE